MMTLTDALAPLIRERFGSDDEFTAEDVLALAPGLFGSQEFPLKGVGKVMTHLIRAGVVRVVRRGFQGSRNYSIYVLGSGLTAREELDSEPDKRVQVTPTPTGRVVRFGAGWRPHREPSEKRAWTGYQSGLSWIK